MPAALFPFRPESDCSSRPRRSPSLLSSLVPLPHHRLRRRGRPHNRQTPRRRTTNTPTWRCASSRRGNRPCRCPRTPRRASLRAGLRAGFAAARWTPPPRFGAGTCSVLGELRASSLRRARAAADVSDARRCVRGALEKEMVCPCAGCRRPAKWQHLRRLFVTPVASDGQTQGDDVE